MSILADLARRDDASGRSARHALLLASLIMLLGALPFLRAAPGGRIRYSVLLCLVLVAAIYVNSLRRWLLVVGGLLGGVAIGAIATAEATGSIAARTLAVSLGFGLLSLTTLIMLNTLMHEERVSRDTIVGGICVYLMLGLSFTMLFQFALYTDPASFAHHGVALGSEGDVSDAAALLLYFSFVCLTTLGFGDITPSSEWTQTLVIAEAIIGQLYVAIFIARLMGLYIAGSREPPDPGVDP